MQILDLPEFLHVRAEFELVRRYVFEDFTATAENSHPSGAHAIRKSILMRTCERYGEENLRANSSLFGIRVF